MKNPVHIDARSFHYLVDPLVEQSSDLVLGHLKKGFAKRVFVSSFGFNLKVAEHSF